ncbi:DUF4188 domain-containing protein [Actinomadura nitritigenes]|uniref:DUF4188 domain-containing protein n=1 Tax=Actinomadura TaxID=1988 RepID=UPI001683F5A0|nr:DUF4188 domain-containing protein [Actinomadura sp. RB99]MBD2892457.1 hypothetical protein [Actinomadura sp. RB99]
MKEKEKDRKVRNGRFSVKNDQDVVVFLVGIRVNKLRAVRKWVPVIRALRPMLRQAEADTESGLLGYRVLRVGRRETVALQYWRTFDDLMAFADGATHRRAWRDFYALATDGAAVGLWHETYVVPAGRYEAIYGIVPPLGLASFRTLLPVGRRNDGARTRLGAATTPERTA